MVATQVAWWGWQATRAWPAEECRELRRVRAEVTEPASSREAMMQADALGRIEAACRKAVLSRQEVQVEVVGQVERLDLLYGDEEHKRAAERRLRADLDGLW